MRHQAVRLMLLTICVASGAIPARAVELQPAPQVGPAERDWRRPVGWLAVGLGVAAIAVGALFHSRAADVADQEGELTPLDRRRVDNLNDELDENQTFMWAGYGTGAALTAGGVALLLSSREPRRAEPRFTAAAPAPDPVAPPATEPVASPTSEPVTSPTSEPVAAAISEPVASPASEPVAAPTSEPVAAAASEPVAAPASEPVAAPASEPVAAPASEPVASRTSEPAGAPVPAPPVAVAPPPPSDGRGFELAVRLGVGTGFGEMRGGGVHSESNGNSHSTTFFSEITVEEDTKAIVPVGIDVGYRVTPALSLGAYFQYATLVLADGEEAFCDPDDTDCSGTLLRYGLRGSWKFFGESSREPWIGLGFGRDDYTLTATAEGTEYEQRATGFEYIVLDGGIDWRLAPRWVLGFVVSASVAQFGDFTRHIDGDDETDPGTPSAGNPHTWIVVGVRGAFAPTRATEAP